MLSPLEQEDVHLMDQEAKAQEVVQPKEQEFSQAAVTETQVVEQVVEQLEHDSVHVEHDEVQLVHIGTKPTHSSSIKRDNLSNSSILIKILLISVMKYYHRPLQQI